MLFHFIFRLTQYSRQYYKLYVLYTTTVSTPSHQERETFSSFHFTATKPEIEASGDDRESKDITILKMPFIRFFFLSFLLPRRNWRLILKANRVMISLLKI